LELVVHIKYKVWLLFVFSIFAYIYVVATYEKPSCLRTVRADEVSRWIDGQLQPVRYIDGNWYDGVSRLIGSSAVEDSDVCVK
jgi:hypothetical protein